MQFRVLIACACATAVFGATEWKVGQRFQIILPVIPDLAAQSPPVPVDAPVFDVDLFDTDAGTIRGLKNLGKTVICYFSAGTYEKWRPDNGDFRPGDVGLPLADWANETWVDVKSENVRAIMATRIKMAAAKGCDAIDPDNTDVYQNSSNFAGTNITVTRSHVIDYVRWMSITAANYSMSTGLKNSGDIIDEVADSIQFAVNEQCAALGECDIYSNFIAAGKPVFQIEYFLHEDGKHPFTAQLRDERCNKNNIKNMSTVFKNLNLDGWVGYCDGNQFTTKTKDGGGTYVPPNNPKPTTKAPKPTSTSRTSSKSTSKTNTSKATSTSKTSTSTKTTTTSKSSSSTKISTTSSKPTSTSTSSSKPTTSAPTSGGCQSKKYDQCGGTNWKGCTQCVAGTSCFAQSPPYYYQCL